jgi:hypothetical protein
MNHGRTRTANLSLRGVRRRGNLVERKSGLSSRLLRSARNDNQGRNMSNSQKPKRTRQEQVQQGINVALAERRAQTVYREAYESFAHEVAGITQREHQFQRMADALQRTVKKWLARGLYWPILSGIIDPLVSPPCEMNPKSSG